ncbi:NAD(P)/FAD-dependent oxidoreductase [Pedobacter hartonius]|uniref:D-amino-acid dehydrogenase n=1 Tax=Pedobacter hartonius TaxID=425514 RepID=A0A1H4GQP2_9SPHI|nr:FAD-dependent oxidoreductase [Pedobacter hartonius]SEB11936.1 D-amino-acid dehydrogenase [Pedobacter hartonius]
MAKAIVIGAGIIGLSSAYYLRQAGWEVTVLEKGNLSDNCSFGNAGMIVPSHFVPLAAPGMLEKGIKWMFNSRSPFYVRPSLNPALLSWGLKFMKSANQQQAAKAAVPLRDISLLSKELYADLTAKIGDFGLSNNGILMLYKTEKVEEEELHTAEQARALGLDAVSLSAAEARQLQPGLELNVKGAVHYRCDAHLNPNLLLALLQRNLLESGVEILKNAEVTKMVHEKGKITLLVAAGQEYAADHYVLATGSWSPEIAKRAGFKIPLMPGKGYSFMVENTQKNMHIAALLCEAKVSVTPMGGKIRFGGTMEIDAINDRIHINRVKGIVESIPAYLPGFQPDLPEKKDIWFGFRPCSPDGLPYLGNSKALHNLTVATGHGMMGISLGPATGMLLSELVNGTPPSMDIQPFSPDRYS